MEPGSRQTPVPANESGGWDSPGEGLLSQRCHRWQVCRSHSSLPTLPAIKKPLECEPRKQTGSWPEQGPLADNCGPLVSFLGWAPLQPHLGHFGKGGSSGGTLGTPRKALPSLYAGKQPQITALIMENNRCLERGGNRRGFSRGRGAVLVRSSESPGWRGAGHTTHGVTLGLSWAEPGAALHGPCGSLPTPGYSRIP